MRVLRVIARMNVGGPAHHVAILAGGLDPEAYETLLVAGRVGPGEASADHLAADHGARLVTIPHLGPPIRPLSDLRALIALIRIVRRFRPDLVHTHTAKAGLLGRLAALAAGRPRPLIVHTFHGHVLRGYFGPLLTEAFRRIERALGRVSDVLIGVSGAVVDDLVGLGVAPRSRFRVVPIGLDLDGFLGVTERRPGGDELRAELGVGPEEVLAAFAGRLAPIKRVDLLLDALALARQRGAPLKLAVAGDGECSASLKEQAGRIGLGDAVKFLGFRDDLTRLAAASDLAVLSSDNEGTPVALIEASAAGRPSVATDVGGVRDIVTPETGRLVAPHDPEAFAAALCELAGDPALRKQLGAAAREHVRGAFSSRRLLADIDRLYRSLAER